MSALLCITIPFSAQTPPKAVQTAEVLQQQLKKNPNDAEANLNFGLVLAGQGDMVNAEKQVRKALAISPNHPGALTALGKILARTDHLDEAREQFEKVVKLQPNSHDARMNLGIALADAGDAKAALAEFQAAVKLAPQSASAHHNLGRAYNDLGQFQRAREELERSLELDPKLLPALQSLALMEREAKNLQRSADLLQRVLALDPNDAVAHYILGDNLSDLSRTEEAISHWKRAVEINPSYRRALYKLSLALRERDPEQSHQYNRRFLKLRKTQQLTDRAGTLGDTGLVYARNGQFPEAIETIKKAIELCGDCAAEGLLHKNLGLVYGKSGDYLNARKQLLVAREILPGDREIDVALEYVNQGIKDANQ